MATTVSQQANPDRFEIAVDDVAAGATYFVDHDGHRLFFHTEVAEAFAGRGLASTLVAHALAATRAEGLRIMATCPYVKQYLRKHHDHDDIIDPVTEEAAAAIPWD